MQSHALFDGSFAIPPHPQSARRPPAARPAGPPWPLALRRRLQALGWVQEASLAGILGLLGAWGLGELVLVLQGF
ncbi:hypothetical protein E2C05_27140 [Paracraurococcus ruber]|uniref:hypothetical protein n=1 Tax=Paracraurococcus ruber TaxID=77675 RepID=UPI001058291A|nr:hypothetical protein [Paracraurococcus ruber]TDG20883.1 hypothetical protein E2C05_27140 [Paracraurococcus ruber]